MKPSVEYGLWQGDYTETKTRSNCMRAREGPSQAFKDLYKRLCIICTLSL